MGEGLITISQGVGHSLQLVVVGGDGEVTLREHLELRLKMDGSAHLIVAEDGLQLAPSAVCCVMIMSRSSSEMVV